MSEDLKVFGKTYSGVTGIQAKDLSGNNIKYFPLSEIGSFTPTTDTQSCSIELGSDSFRLVCFWLSSTSSSPLNNSKRVQYSRVFKIDSGTIQRIMGVYSNASGASWTGVETTGNDSSTFSNGILTINCNYLIAGCTYNWIAVP